MGGTSLSQTLYTRQGQKHILRTDKNPTISFHYSPLDTSATTKSLNFASIWTYVICFDD